MALESRLRPAPPVDLDGVDRILLAQVALQLEQHPDTSAPLTIAIVNAQSPQFLRELKLLAPAAAFLVHNDLLHHQVLLDDAGLATRCQPDLASGLVYAPELFTGTDIVVARLPKSLNALASLASSAAQHLGPSAVFLAGARQKYLVPAQSTTLAKSFGSVQASLGQFKSRVLIASDPVPGTVASPAVTAQLADIDLAVGAYGGVFAGTKLDIGTRLLIATIPDLLADYTEAKDFVDLGCGTGLLSAYLVRHREEARVRASDLSRIAVQSTMLTAQLNGMADRITVTQDNALAGLPGQSADVVVCNPPFHASTTLETDTARTMFEQAARVLRPGGEMWTVFNTPLKYGSALSRAVGPTEVIAQNSKFQVTRSTKSFTA